jgi:WD40 repeat protein/tRNA A-37 threonylcarbamoyl transferase component Bud32
MTCCLNPDCQHPQNPDDAEFCLHCGAKLSLLLRGRYRVVRPLGQGGFGRTYLAVDEDRLNARSVIKQFSPQVKGSKSLDKAIQLFQQEAERLNELGEHPQIPTLLAYFEHDQRLYLVQQFIEGQTLLQELAQHGLFSERKIREILAGVLPVLKFVHDHQVVHRDITPSNIIRRASDKKLVLIDFGVAKLLSSETAAQPGTKIGTEGYAPMEQLRSGKAYPASDLYSLAATCIYLMTQTKPDDLYDPLEGRWLWREKLAEKGGTVSPAISDILDKLLKDLVSERYQSADAVMRDLRLALSRPMGMPPLTGSSAAGAAARLAASRPLASPSRPHPSQPPAPASGQPPVSGGLAAPPASSEAQFPSNPFSASPVSSSRSNSGEKSGAVPRVSNPPSKPPVPISGGGFKGGHTSDRHSLMTLAGHSRWVTAVAISANGQHVVSGGLDDRIRVWNLETGELLNTLMGHTKPVNSLVISSDGQLLVSGSDDHTIRIWNLQTGMPLHTLVGHSRDVNALALHAGGQLLASGGDDRTARLWKFPTGEPLRAFSNLAGMIRAVAMTPDGQLLASGGLDNQIKLWSLKTGELAQTFSRSHFGAINALAISPTGKLLISASKDKTIKFWNLATGEVLKTLTGHTDSVNAIALSSNGKVLVSGSADTTVKVWNVDTGTLKETLNEHTNAVNAVSLNLNSHRVASASSDNTVKIWQVV